MKLFDILKQQGLFSNDIRTRIKNKQITINGEIATFDVDLNIKMLSDDAKIILEKLSNFDDNFKIEIDQNKSQLFSTLLKITFGDDSILIEEVFSKLNVNLPELITFKIGEMKNILNDFLSQEINIATIRESGEFICDLGKLNSIFITQMKIFGFENLFESNIKNELSNILNDHFLIKISKKDSFILNKKNG